MALSRLIIVRHGNTFEAGEAPRRVGRGTDLPLTATGHAQAAAVGRALREFRFSYCLAGKLTRTQQSAADILSAAGQNLPIEPADFLTEIDHGPDENRTEPEVEARIGKGALEAWDSQAIAPPGWIVDREARLAGWRALADRVAGDVLLVTSNGAARFALLAFGLPVGKLRTGAYGIIEAGGDGMFRLGKWDTRP